MSKKKSVKPGVYIRGVWGSDPPSLQNWLKVGPKICLSNNYIAPTTLDILGSYEFFHRFLSCFVNLINSTTMKYMLNLKFSFKLASFWNSY